WLEKKFRGISYYKHTTCRTRATLDFSAMVGMNASQIQNYSGWCQSKQAHHHRQQNNFIEFLAHLFSYDLIARREYVCTAAHLYKFQGILVSGRTFVYAQVCQGAQAPVCIVT